MQLPFLVGALVFARALVAPAAHAEGPVLIDRVVAVVDDRTILRSDIAARAEPYVARLDAKDRADPAKLRELHREVLERMIEETLVSKEAKKDRITVSDEEVDHAMVEIAKESKLSRAELVAEVKKQGLSLEQYRDELSRQILDMKWVQLKVRPKIVEPTTGTDQEKKKMIAVLVEAERKKQLAQLRAQLYVELH